MPFQPGVATTLRHGHKRGTGESLEYRAWRSMISRCRNPKASSYALYGGRGIAVCERWSVFDRFLDDMGLKPGPSYSLDRIDNDKGYGPDNCRWVPLSEQSGNRRCCLAIVAFGETNNVAAWARKTGIGESTIRLRIKAGWSHERAVSTSAGPNGIKAPKAPAPARTERERENET